MLSLFLLLACRVTSPFIIFSYFFNALFPFYDYIHFLVLLDIFSYTYFLLLEIDLGLLHTTPPKYNSFHLINHIKNSYFYTVLMFILLLLHYLIP